MGAERGASLAAALRRRTGLVASACSFPHMRSRLCPLAHERSAFFILVALSFLSSLDLPHTGL